MIWRRGSPSRPGGEVYYLQCTHNGVLYTICKVSIDGVPRYELWRGPKEYVKHFASSGPAKEHAVKLSEGKDA